MEGGLLLPLSPLNSPLLSSLTLEVGRLNPASGPRVAFPSGVWGRALAEIEFGAF